MCTPTLANPGEYPSPGDLLVELDMDPLLATVYIHSATTRRVRCGATRAQKTRNSAQGCALWHLNDVRL